MRTVTYTAESEKEGMTREEILRVLAPNEQTRNTITNIKARVGLGGRIKSLTWIETP